MTLLLWKRGREIDFRTCEQQHVGGERKEGVDHRGRSVTRGPHYNFNHDRRRVSWLSGEVGQARLNVASPSVNRTGLTSRFKAACLVKAACGNGNKPVVPSV